MVEKYDIIGKNYNTTRKPDPYLTDRIMHHLSPIKSGRYLDIGCGTGNYTTALFSKGVNILGIDPSITMLQSAQKREATIKWLQGIAEDIPVENEAIDGIVATLTIHHWENRSAGFKELHRVLKPNGKLVIFTSTPEQMQGYWLNHYFPEMLNNSAIQMPSLESVYHDLKAASFELSGTEPYTIKEDLQDLFLYAGKHNPKLYLDPNVRSGISSFSALAHMKEIESGLQKLSQDIRTNKINEVISEYENNLGDYLFVIATKINQ